jgi:putative sterol carrier protein
VSDKFAFLTDEWIAAVEAIVANAATEVAAATTGNLVVNLNVTDTPFGADKQFHMGSIDGAALMGGGHKEPGDVTLTTDYATAKAVFISGDQQAGMQAFMSGKVKVQGDMTKLMMQQQGGGGASPEMQAAIQAITE